MSDAVRVPRRLSKPDVGGGVSHPARYSDGLLPVFAGFLQPGWRVLDPFAGTGVIHQIRALVDVTTTGIEIEPEWAGLHPDTQVGSALDMPFDDECFEAAITSPCYGNRMSDSYNATDPQSRRSYRHDLGRPLHPDNSGSLQWGPRYRTFHEAAWEETLRVLVPGGIFVLNVKDHIRAGQWRDVTAWHAQTIVNLGCTLFACRPFVAHHLRGGANAQARVGAEMVFAFTKEIGR